MRGEQGVGAVDFKNVTPCGFEKARVRLKAPDADVTRLAQERPTRTALVAAP
jgi:hypothetical protein